MMDGSKKGSISEKVYNGLRVSIVNLKLKPGEEIKINLIAENLGVSRSPVRDALLELEKEGLVDILPQIGTRVSKIDMERMHEERFLRSSLEEKTLEIFLTHHTEEDLYALKKNLEKQKKSVDEKDYPTFLNLDDEYHKIFFAAANKARCWELIRNMSGHYRRVRLLVLRATTVADNILSQHNELLELISGKRNEEAQKVIKNHLSKIIMEEKELLQEFPEYFKTNASGDFFSGL